MENMARVENWVWSCSTEGDLEMTHGSSRSADQNPEYLNQLCCSCAAKYTICVLVVIK